MSGDLTTNINDLINPNNEKYKVLASIIDGSVDPASSTVIGNKGFSNLFSAPKKELGKMDFLRLLVTQLQYQDPIEPMDSTDFVSQLAQFSQLEGTSNIEQAISSLDQSYKNTLDMQSFSAISMTNASAVSLIGKEVRIAQATLKFTGIPGEDATVRVHLGNNDSATVKIMDANGETIRSLAAGNKDAENSVFLSWDGKNDEGEYVQAGTYYLYVEGQDTDSSLYCFVEDVVQGVRYTAEGPLIKIGGKELPIGNILDISMSQTSNSNDSNFGVTNVLALLGKVVKYRKPELRYTPADNQFVDVNVNLAGFQTATIQVKDMYGNVVYTFKVESEDGTTAHATLPCTDFNGSGPYTLSIVGNSSAYFYGEGTVDGISTVDGKTQIRVNGITVSLSEIFDISTPTVTV